MLLAQIIPDVPVPAWVQILASAVGLAVAVYVAIAGSIRKAVPAKSTDVIVPTMTIADSGAIKALAEELKLWAYTQKNSLEIATNILYEIRRNNDISDDMKNIMEQFVKTVVMDVKRNNEILDDIRLVLERNTLIQRGT